MNPDDISIAVPQWPETKHIIRSKRKLEYFTHKYFYPFLFFFYTIALWILFALYKLLLTLTLKIYLIIKRLEKTRLKRRLVIVGGGYAGTTAAKILEHDFLVTLIDSKDYFEFTPSKLRILVDPKHNTKVQVKHKSFLSKTLIVTDFVKGITPDAVLTESQSISYDYLIICSGSRTPDVKFAKKISDHNHYEHNHNSNVISVRTQHFEDYHPILKSSQTILVIGGGTVGVELAGEIVENFGNKNVIIVHSGSKLMPRSPEKAIKYTEEFFRRNNATLIFGDKVVGQDRNTFFTANGETIEADVAFICTGNVPNTEFLKNPFFADNLNPYGFVKVNPFLQLEGYSNIFVAGDLTYIPEQEEKLCQTAAAEVKVVVSNIKSMELGNPMIKYTAASCPILVSLGKYDGILMYKGFAFTGFVPAAMKEFVEWKEMIHYWGWTHFQIGTKSSSEKWSSHAHIV